MQLSHLFLVMLVSKFIYIHTDQLNCTGCAQGPGDCCGEPVSNSINPNCGSCKASSCKGSGLEKCEGCSHNNNCTLSFTSPTYCTDKCWGRLAGKYLTLYIVQYHNDTLIFDLYDRYSMSESWKYIHLPRKFR